MANTPYSILDNQLTQLRSYYEDRERKLRIQQLPKARHNAVVSNMQAEYDANKFKIQSLRSQLDDVRRSNADPALANEAMWRLVVPEEHAAAMFPGPIKEPTERVPISPSGLISHKGTMEQFAKGAKEEPGWEWGPPKRKQENLEHQYVVWREAMGYNNYTPGQQRQLDFQWDTLMGEHKEYEWDPASPGIKTLRTYGGRLTGVAAKKISPLAKSIEKSKPFLTEQRKWRLGKFTHPLRAGPMPESRTLDAGTAKTILQEAGGDKEKARQIAKQRGYKL